MERHFFDYPTTVKMLCSSIALRILHLSISNPKLDQEISTKLSSIAICVTAILSQPKQEKGILKNPTHFPIRDRNSTNNLGNVTGTHSPIHTVQSWKKEEN